MAKYLTNLPSDGTVLGQTVSDKIAFFGATAVTQPTSASQAAVTSSVTTTTPTVTAFGYTSAQAAALLQVVIDTKALANQLRSDLVTLGIIKGS